MLLSMTGFGDARTQTEHVSVAVEVRSVNNRYLKIATKMTEAYAPLEGEIEKVVRQSVSRGTVNVTVRVRRLGGAQEYVVDRDVLEEYWRQLMGLSKSMHLPAPTHLGELLQLPGVVTDAERSPADSPRDWPAIRQALAEALQKLCDFRKKEGESMREDLRSNAAVIAKEIETVATRAPQVVTDFRDRVLERVRELLAGTDVAVDESQLIREVSIFAERCDVNEELMRLRSHLEQFETFLSRETSEGRKLDFLAQEMFREVNTLGSKGNDVAIAHAVVEMKAGIEKIREILQNVE